jgi:hypothetical protein
LRGFRFFYIDQTISDAEEEGVLKKMLKQYGKDMKPLSSPLPT